MNRIDALKAVMGLANKNLCKEIVSLFPELKEVTVAESRQALSELLKSKEDKVVIVLEGGCITNVYANSLMDVQIIDLDDDLDDNCDIEKAKADVAHSTLINIY